MKKKYGIFEINRKSKYLKDGLDSIEFLSERFLHDSEENALYWIPDEDGHYIIMPVYVKDDNQKLKNENKRLQNLFPKTYKKDNQTNAVTKNTSNLKLKDVDISKIGRISLKNVKQHNHENT
jgi:hypothetical protein